MPKSIPKRYQPLAHSCDARITAVFSHRLFQNMSLCYGHTRKALINRNNFLRTLGIDYRNLTCARQIHSSSVRYVREKDKGKGALSYNTAIADTDALITDKKNIPLAIFTADCLSVFLYDSARPAVSLVHAGWRSTQGDILNKTLSLMQKEFNTKLKNLFVGFGPSIRGCCYEVGREFYQNFAQDYLREKAGRIYLDLVGINKAKLLGAGIKEENIFDPLICTSCKNNDFFSFRKEGQDCGRTMSVIMLRS